MMSATQVQKKEGVTCHPVFSERSSLCWWLHVDLTFYDSGTLSSSTPAIMQRYLLALEGILVLLRKDAIVEVVLTTCHKCFSNFNNKNSWLFCDPMQRSMSINFAHLGFFLLDWHISLIRLPIKRKQWNSVVLRNSFKFNNVFPVLFSWFGSHAVFKTKCVRRWPLCLVSCSFLCVFWMARMYRFAFACGIHEKRNWRHKGQSLMSFALSYFLDRYYFGLSITFECLEMLVAMMQHPYIIHFWWVWFVLLFWLHICIASQILVTFAILTQCIFALYDAAVHSVAHRPGWLVRFWVSQFVFCSI